jgi:hypothetical protein
MRKNIEWNPADAQKTAPLRLCLKEYARKDARAQYNAFIIRYSICIFPFQTIFT